MLSRTAMAKKTERTLVREKQDHFITAHPASPLARTNCRPKRKKGPPTALSPTRQERETGPFHHPFLHSCTATRGSPSRAGGHVDVDAPMYADGDRVRGAASTAARGCGLSLQGFAMAQVRRRTSTHYFQPWTVTTVGRFNPMRLRAPEPRLRLRKLFPTRQAVADLVHAATEARVVDPGKLDAGSLPATPLITSMCRSTSAAVGGSN